MTDSKPLRCGFRYSDVGGQEEKGYEKNVEVICRKKKELMELTMTRKKDWIGYILKRLLKNLIEGWIEMKHPSGRRRISLLEELKEISFVEIKRRKENREKREKTEASTCH